MTLVAWLFAGCGKKTYVTNNYYEPDDRDAAAEQPPVDVPDAQAPDAQAPDAQAPDAQVPPDEGDASTDDAGAPPPDGSGEPVPLAEGAPLVNATPNELELDVFGTFDNSYWFVVSEEEVARMNEQYGGGGPIIFFGNDYGDIYTPGGTSDEPTFADHVLVTTTANKTADFGKMQVNLVGESTGRPWTESSLPNVKIDTNEFVQKNRLGGYEHIRFNNAVVGSIFREKYALDFYRALGYPAPLASYGWVSSSVWGPDVRVPYVVTEAYKRNFCKQREDYFGGECPNMWEFAGDFGFGAFDSPDACQFSECDSTRVDEFEERVMSTPEGDGYKAALAEFLDWDRFHEFQCLSWIFATGDDALHNTNNFVLVERPDGMFQLLPYSVDISFGQDWYADVPLAGQSSLARGCQSETQCWADTIATCENMLAAFIDADPVSRLDDLYQDLETAGMLRPGDDNRYEDMRAYLERRIEELPIELEENREGPNNNTCEPPLVMCGDYCELPEYCYVCDDDGGGPIVDGPIIDGPIGQPEPRPLFAAGANLVAPIPVPVDSDAGAADIGLADPIAPLPPPGEPVEPGDDGGLDPGPEPEPVPCLPRIEHYAAEAG